MNDLLKFKKVLHGVLNKYAHLPPEEVGGILVEQGVTLVTNATNNLDYGLKSLDVRITDGLRRHVEYVNQNDLEKNTRKIAKELGSILADNAM